MKISKPENTEAANCLVIYEWASHYNAFAYLEHEVLDRDQDHDDDTPPYQFLQRISSQISRAQSGDGPFRARLLDIAELAIAAVLSIDRSQS